MLTDQQHPITPPPELTDVWKNLPLSDEEIFVIASRWGADQQLNADCKWLHRRCLISGAEELRAAMRPKPPSLAEQALKALQNQIDTSFKISSEAQERADTIRRALERLKELEKGND